MRSNKKITGIFEKTMTNFPISRFYLRNSISFSFNKNPGDRISHSGRIMTMCLVISRAYFFSPCTFGRDFICRLYRWKPQAFTYCAVARGKRCWAKHCSNISYLFCELDLLSLLYRCHFYCLFIRDKSI